MGLNESMACTANTEPGSRPLLAPVRRQEREGAAGHRSSLQSTDRQTDRHTHTHTHIHRPYTPYLIRPAIALQAPGLNDKCLLDTLKACDLHLEMSCPLQCRGAVRRRRGAGAHKTHTKGVYEAAVPRCSHAAQRGSQAAQRGRGAKHTSKECRRDHRHARERIAEGASLKPRGGGA